MNPRDGLDAFLCALMILHFPGRWRLAAIMPPPKRLSHLRVAHTGEALATRLRTSRSSLVLDDERDSLGDTGTPAATHTEILRNTHTRITHSPLRPCCTPTPLRARRSVRTSLRPLPLLSLADSQAHPAAPHRTAPRRQRALRWSCGRARRRRSRSGPSRPPAPPTSSPTPRPRLPAVSITSLALPALC